MPRREDESIEGAATPEPVPLPGEFVSDDLADDCARFLEDLRRRAGRAEGNRVESEK